ncbi:hypothetical protein PLICRDRAFT_45832 [Plicaturopsis crispa FD-325 SS-3]|uniref:Uncharacterized protein n=1 Tax=Plicaturopsis crispa FD-325 SS-3 TaxID=944288 RepID=A0A0C9T6K9_PLICR|nr:hypothetical protein PLICRDRAFT_45832 [Plicaturopsis crispa FD-325 SS-3]
MARRAYTPECPPLLTLGEMQLPYMVILWQLIAVKKRSTTPRTTLYKGLLHLVQYERLKLDRIPHDAVFPALDEAISASRACC